MQTMAQLIAPAVAPVLTETLTTFEAARASAAAPERRVALAGACEELAACVDGTAHAAWAPHLLRVATALRSASAVAPADITAIRAIRPEPMLGLLAPQVASTLLERAAQVGRNRREERVALQTDDGPRRAELRRQRDQTVALLVPAAVGVAEARG